MTVREGTWLPVIYPVPSPFSDTFLRVVTRPAVAESVFASESLDLILDSQSQGDSEGTVVVVIVVDRQVSVFVGE